MPDYATKEEVASLRAMLTDLSNTVSRSQSGATSTDDATAIAEGGSALVVPFWEVTVAESLTLTEGISDDWDPRFDVLTVATNRVKFEWPTVTGALHYSYIGPTAYRRFRIAWESETANTFTMILTGSRSYDGFGGYLQLKLNGQIYEYQLDSPAGAPAPTQHVISVEQKEGPNYLTICSQYAPFETILAGRLWDPTTGGRFIDPRGETGHVKN